MTNDSIREIAERLGQSAGLLPPYDVQPLTGGRNNRVYRLVSVGGRDAALKCYHSDAQDPRDRLAAEWNFLTYIRVRGVDNVPLPLARDDGAHAALYSFIGGKRPRAASAELMRQAADFVIAINRERCDPSALAPASEACFSVEEHIATIDRRVARLTSLDAESAPLDEVNAFVRGKLVPTWDQARAKIHHEISMRRVPFCGAIKHAIASPSDFGFHNCLVDLRGRATFLDFEYAGLDDPAKLICDFFCQPEVPVPLLYLDEFVGRLTIDLGLDEGDVWRARILLDAYRIKWVCIMLNEFSTAGARRRAFASSAVDSGRAAFQLGKAKEALARVACM